MMKKIFIKTPKEGINHRREEIEQGQKNVSDKCKTHNLDIGHL